MPPPKKSALSIKTKQKQNKTKQRLTPSLHIAECVDSTNGLNRNVHLHCPRKSYLEDYLDGYRYRGVVMCRRPELDDLSRSCRILS